MRMGFSWVLATSLFLQLPIYGHKNQAVIQATCKSLTLHDVRWTDPTLGTRDTTFTTYDGSPALLSTNNGSSVYYSGELRPRTSQPGIFETDYATMNAAGHITASGSTTFSLPTADTDGNGIPDFMQFNKGASYSASGSFLADYPQPGTSTVSGTFSKPANSTRTTYSAKLNMGAHIIDFSGAFETLYVSGGISYRRAPNKLFISARQITSHNTFTYTGTNISFRVNNPNQFSMEQAILTRNDGMQITLFPASFYRVGNKYTAHVEVDDSDYSSHWRDYTQWVFEVIDLNDWDADGIPDLTDNPPSAPLISQHPASRVVSLGSPTTFRVTAIAHPEPAYQWRKNGVPIAGATQSIFTIRDVRLSDAGDYTVLVKNFVGKQLSTPAELVVCDYALGSPYQLVDRHAGDHSLTLTTSGSCVWSIQNTNEWITFSQSQGNGSALLSYHVSANTTPTARAARITIGNKIFIINQLGIPAPTQSAINGCTIVFAVSSASGALSSNETYLFKLSQFSNEWRQVTRVGQPVGSGTFAFESLSDTQIRLTLGNGAALHLTFASSTAGQAAYTGAGGDTQSGTFVLTKSKPDFNNDAFSDLLWQHANGTLRTWFMRGNSLQGAANMKTLGSGWRVAGQSDLNRDGHTDLILQHQDLRVAGWLLNGTNFLSAIPMPLPGKGARLVGIADFNDDERDDLLLQNANNILFVRLMNGTTVTGSKLVRGGTPLPTGFRMAQVADLNRDGESDLILQHADGRIITWFLNGTDLISAVLIRKVGPGWKVVGANDVNFDGHTDLLLYNQDGRTAAWLLEEGAFSSALSLSNGRPPNPLLKLVGPK